MSDRARALEELQARAFDVLVVGGGIVGASIAAEAARAGLAVALVERGDFGGATSSGSSKLIHGGLRYLRMGDVRLVRESHQERHALLRVVAPHLVRPMPFLVPLYRHGPFRPATMKAGLSLYSLLAGDGRRGLVPPISARRRTPGLRTDGLRACGLYFDAWTNDARLCLANVNAAAGFGATVVNYAEVAALHMVAGRVAGADVLDRETEAAVPVQARAVVNATGPWVDRVRRLEDPSAASSYRLSKGVHVLVPQPSGWSAALAVFQDRSRVTFAVPWAGMLLLGTTDAPYDGDPDELAVTEADVAQVLAEAEHALEPGLVASKRVRATFAGLRVLPGRGGRTDEVRRTTVMTRGPAGMLSIAGGKLTTYRRIALAALGHLRADVALHRVDRRPWPLSGAGDLDRVSLPSELRYETRANLLHLYGSAAADVVALAAGDATLLEPLDPAGPDIAAQAVYGALREWARTPEDVLRRRTTVALRGLASAAVEQRVAELLAADRIEAVSATAGR